MASLTRSSLHSLSEDSYCTDPTPDDFDEQKSFPDHALLAAVCVKTTAKLRSQTNIKNFQHISQLKTFSNVVFSGDTMWISGWNINTLHQKDTVLVNVQASDFSEIDKHKRTDPQADLPLIMCPSQNCLLFAKRGDSEIYIFDTRSQKFKGLACGTNFAIVALCADDNYTYIFDKKLPDQIRVSDGTLKELRTIPIGFGYNKECGIDMCLISSIDEQSPVHSESKRKHWGSNQTIIISVSFPYGSIRAFSLAKGKHWVLDCQSHPDLLGPLFNPSSISASETGNIFIADRGTNRVCNSFIILYLSRK